MAKGKIEISTEPVCGIDELAGAARIRRNFHGKLAVVIVGKTHEGYADLTELAGALDAARARAYFLNRGKQQGGEDPDDRRDDQEFDKRESLSPIVHRTG